MEKCSPMQQMGKWRNLEENGEIIKTVVVGSMVPKFRKMFYSTPFF